MLLIISVDNGDLYVNIMWLVSFAALFLLNLSCISHTSVSISSNDKTNFIRPNPKSCSTLSNLVLQFLKICALLKFINNPVFKYELKYQMWF